MVNVALDGKDMRKNTHLQREPNNEAPSSGEDELNKLEADLAEAGLEATVIDKVRAIFEQLEPAFRDLDRNPLLRDDDLQLHQSRPEEDTAGEAAKIPECRACGGFCCEVIGPNTIISTQSEWQGLKGTEHLRIEEGFENRELLHLFCSNAHNGCTGCGPSDKRNGYPGAKPRDCNDYPFLTSINEYGKLSLWVADNTNLYPNTPPKCQLSGAAKFSHLPWVTNSFQTEVMANLKISRAYINAHEGMVGYRLFDPSHLEGLSSKELHTVLEVSIARGFGKAMEALRERDSKLVDIQALMEYGQALRTKTDQAKNLVSAYRYSQWQFPV